MKKTPLPCCPSFERSEEGHRSPASLLAAISSHCLAALPPAKMSASVLPQPFLQKSPDSQKYSLHLKQITRFKISEVNSFA